MNRLKLLSASLLLNAKISPGAIAAQFKGKYIAPSKALQFISLENIKLSAVQMGLRPYNTLGDYLSHIQSLVRQGTEKGAQLICFPEFVGVLPVMISLTHYDACLEIADAVLAGEENKAAPLMEHFREHLSAPLFDCYYNTFSMLAHQYQVYLLAGSTIIADREGLHNRSFLFAPSGDCILEQDKLCLNPSELRLGFVPGADLEVVPTPLGRLCVLSGRDNRTFEPAKAAVAGGAQILLCPGGMHRTESPAFYQSGSLMRCQEQQVFSVSSCLVGDLLDMTFRGQSGVFGPYEVSRTGTGIFAQAASMTQESVVTSRVNLERLGHHVNLHTADVNPAVYQQMQQVYAMQKADAAPLPTSPDTEEEEPQE